MLDDICLTSTRYFLLLTELLEEKGVSIQRVLVDTGVELSELKNPENHLNLKQTEKLLTNANRLSSDDYLGVQLGQRMNVGSHGVIGFAGLTSKNARESLLFAVRYFPIATSVMSLRFYEDEEFGYLEIRPADNVPDLVERFVIQTIVSTFDVMMRFLIGSALDGAFVELAYEPQEEVADYIQNSHVDIRFNKTAHRLVFPQQALNTPFALADATAKQQAVSQCEEKLNQLENNQSFSARIYQQLLSADETIPSIEEVADYLHISSRTVRRHLEKEGVSYRDLVNQARIDKAMKLMRKKYTSITQVAYQLGYGDSANFTRAFKRITGITPSEYRAEHIDK